MTHAGKTQPFVGHKWIPIYADEPDTPTLWIYFDEQAPEICEKYAEKISALINQAGVVSIKIMSEQVEWTMDRLGCNAEEAIEFCQGFVGNLYATGGLTSVRRLPSPEKEELVREKLANLCHEQWSGWVRYMFSKGVFNADGTWTMPAWAVERWKRQMETSYSELSESEQDSDRNEADKFLSIINAA